jgi:hypothetical protein
MSNDQESERRSHANDFEYTHRTISGHSPFDVVEWCIRMAQLGWEAISIVSNRDAQIIYFKRRRENV